MRYPDDRSQFIEYLENDVILSDIPGTEKMYKHKKDKFNYGHLTLSNKLRVVFVEDPDTTMSGAHMYVGTGIVCDPEDAQGLSHFLEHMLFMGSAKYPDVDAFMNMINVSGGMTNAFTTERDTQYYFSISSTDAMKAFDCFSGFFTDPTFNPSYIDKESSAVHSEHQKNIGIDGWRKNILFKKYMDQNDNQKVHTKFGTGTRDTLIGRKSTTLLRNQLIEYFNTHYCADQMLLIVYHNSIDNEFIRMISELFDRIPLNDSSKTKKIMNQPGIFIDNAPDGIDTIYMKAITKTNNLELSWLIDTNYKYHNNTRIDPIQLLCHVLGSEGEGSLDALLKSKNKIYSLFAGVGTNYGSNSSFGISTEMPNCTDKHVIETINQIINYIRNLKRVYSDTQLYDELYDEQYNLNILSFKNFHQFGIDKMQTIVDHIINLDIDPTFCNVSGALKSDRQKMYDLFIGCLDQMEIDALKIMIICDTYDRADETEPYYGTLYRKSSIPYMHIVDIDMKKSEYPLPNKYIDRMDNILNCVERKKNNSDSVKDTLYHRYKRLRTIYPQNRVYVERGNKYDSLNEVIIISIKRKHLKADPLLNIMLTIYNMYMERRLNKEIYMMNSAGYTINCVFDVRTTTLIFDGYCAKIDEIIKNILTQYLEIDDIDIGLYTIVYDEIKQTLENSRMIEPYNQISYLFNENAHGEYYCSNESLLEAIERVSPQNIQNKQNTININNFMDRCKENIFYGIIRGSMAGGITEDRAADIIQFIEKLFIPVDSMTPSTSSPLNIVTTNRIKENYNEFDPNNALLYSFYLDRMIMTDSAAYDSNKWTRLTLISGILSSIAADKFSTYMRTKNETGYIATAMLKNVSRDFTTHVYLSFMIQTELDRKKIFKKMQQYIGSELSNDLYNITDEEFEKIKIATRSSLTHQPKNIYDELHEINAILNMRQYPDDDIELFDRNKRLVATLATLDKHTFIKIALDWLLNRRTHPDHLISIVVKNA